jgi:gliding motility-associated-like protein
MKKILVVALIYSFFTQKIQSQSLGVYPNTYNLSCGVNCTNFNFKIPQLKSTEAYTVGNIPYTPFAFTSLLGIEDIDLYDDDKFSNPQPIGFPFCFYGQAFNDIIIGSNSVVTFDLRNGNCANAWSLQETNSSNPVPLPFTGTQDCSDDTGPKYPTNSIMAAYQDIDPSITTPNPKIEWRQEGILPFRRFIVSFNQVALFGDEDLIFTGQIVIYESTSYIEVFIKNKPIIGGPNPWNGDLAILGIQKDNSTFVAAPDKNCTVWDAANEGYRFKPNGASSLLQNVTITKKDGSLVGVGVVGASLNDSTNISFNNYCISGSGPDTLLVKANYNAACTGGAPFTLVDTIYVTKNPGQLLATTTVTEAVCTSATGAIVVNVPTGAGTAPYQYSINGGALQTNNNFTGLAPNSYTIFVKDASGSCTSTLTVNVGLTNPVIVTPVPSPTTCNGSATGSVIINTTNTTTPIIYTINGYPSQTTNSFTALPVGNYSVNILDAKGCSKTAFFTIANGSALTATVTPTEASCAIAANGSITVTNPSGTAPHQYAINAGAFGTANTFTGLTVGSYTIKVKDVNGCNNNFTVNIEAGAGITATVTPTPTSCVGVSNGSITVTNPTGTAPHQYAVDGGAYSSIATFTGLTAGSHTIAVRDFYGCPFSQATTIAQGVNLTSTSVITNVKCKDGNTGAITITPTNGNAPYQYSINGSVYQPLTTITGLVAGTYNIVLRDNSNCSGSLILNITEPPLLTIAALATPVLCNGQNNGKIKIVGTGGTSPYTYSTDGVTYQTADEFSVTAGLYTVYIKDANDCVKSTTTNIIQPATLSLNGSTVSANCNAQGKISVVANGGVMPYTYANDGISFSAVSSFDLPAGPHIITVKDANNCTATFTTTVGLINNIILLKRTDTTLCESKSVLLTATGNATSYSWLPTLGLNSPTSATPIATPTTSTKYYVTAKLGTCTKLDSVDVTVNPAPIPDAGPGTTICFGKDYTLQGSGGVNYSWTPTATLIGANTATPVATPATTTTYQLRVIDNLGCASLVSDDVTVIITPPVVAYAGPDTTIVMGQPYQLQAIGAPFAVWSPSFDLDNPNVLNPIATLFVDRTYTVTVSTLDGCKGTATVKLKVIKGPEIYTPTVFTPNGDGKNDVLKVVPVGIVKLNYLRVYNRWGLVVFETTNSAVGWDGKIKDTTAPEGTYVYMVQGLSDKGKLITDKGTVILAR